MRFFLMLCVWMFLAVPAGAQEKMYMRVVARDDTWMGQTEKYIIRNMALLLGKEDAYLLEAWYPACRVERKIWQPEKRIPPAETVYITIGPGEGRNWWGILYPESAGWAACPEGRGITFPLLAWLQQVFSWR